MYYRAATDVEIAVYNPFTTFFISDNGMRAITVNCISNVEADMAAVETGIS